MEIYENLCNNHRRGYGIKIDVCIGCKQHIGVKTDSKCKLTEELIPEEELTQVTNELIKYK